MKKALLLFCTAFLLFSCNPAEKFTVIEAREPLFFGLTSLHGKAVVKSDAKKDLVVESAILDFSYKNRHLAAARLMLPIEIPARAVSPVRYDLKLEPESLLSVQTLMNRMETNPSQVFVDVTAWVRYGNIRRKIEMEGIPYTQIIYNFAQR